MSVVAVTKVTQQPQPSDEVSVLAAVVEEEN
jgi:hypothetical protein